MKEVVFNEPDFKHTRNNLGCSALQDAMMTITS